MYVNFNDEIVPPLADYGGGAGTGAHFLFEPGFPRQDNNRLYTVDWGRSGIFQHQLQRSGASFEEIESKLFMTVDRVTDMAADGESNLYISSWAGGRYRYGGEEVGYVLRVSPKSSDVQAFPEIAMLPATELVELLAAPSATKQLMAQRELLRRENVHPDPIAALAKDPEQTAETRVAALFTLVQLPDFDPLPTLTSLVSDPAIGHLAIRAMGNDPDSDDPRAKPALQKALESDLPLRQLEAMVVVARQNRLPLASSIIPLSNAPDPLLAHTAINDLAKMQASKACLAALDNPAIASTGPLRALEKMHDEAVVHSLIEKLNTDIASSLRSAILDALARLAHKEGEWEGSSWGTRPDTRGPYFDPEPWAATKNILDTLNRALTKPEADQKALLEAMAKNRLIDAEQLPTIRALAEKNPHLELPYLKAVRDLGSPSDEATAFIARIAASPERSLETRANAAYVLLSQSDSDNARLGFQAFKQVALRAQSPDEQRLVQDTAEIFLKNERLADWTDWLLQETDTPSDRANQVAWAALLQTRYEPDVDASVKEDVEAAIQAARGSHDRRIPLLEAIANHQIREASELIVESSASEVPTIRESARDAAEILGIELESSEPSGPTIAEMTRGQALEEIASTSGDPKLGEAPFTRQTCALCHTVDPDEALKGPYLGNIASIFDRQELAVAIMDPNDSIAQGFVTNVITLLDGSIVSGFVSFESSDVVELRDITGNARRVANKDIVTRDHLPTSMMPPGLVSSLSTRELASLIAYLEKLDEEN